MRRVNVPRYGPASGPSRAVTEPLTRIERVLLLYESSALTS
jgi:hypothetical protein